MQSSESTSPTYWSSRLVQHRAAVVIAHALRNPCVLRWHVDMGSSSDWTLAFRLQPQVAAVKTIQFGEWQSLARGDQARALTR
eukprot:2315468-Pyramimonas_sp.AAC.2